MKVDILCFLLIRLAQHFCFSDNPDLGSNFILVELLETAQEVLRNSTDMQACMNEAADLAALVAKLKEEHAKALEERDLNHGSEMSKLTEQISSLNGSLDTVAKHTKQLQNQLREAEDRLAAHVDDMAALHDHVLGKPTLCQRCRLPLVGIKKFDVYFSIFCSPCQLGRHRRWSFLPRSHAPGGRDYLLHRQCRQDLCRQVLPRQH